MTTTVEIEQNTIGQQHRQSSAADITAAAEALLQLKYQNQSNTVPENQTNVQTQFRGQNPATLARNANEQYVMHHVQTIHLHPELQSKLKIIQERINVIEQKTPKLLSQLDAELNQLKVCKQQILSCGKPIIQNPVLK